MYAQLTSRFWARAAARTILGEQRYLRWNGRRRERHFFAAGVVFLHVPKAAGSSISQALYGTRLGHPTADELAKFSARAWQELPKLAVIRDPLSRLASAYRYVVSGGTREGAVRFRRIYREPAFRTFETFVKEWLPRVDLLEQDIVFWPQCRFLSREGQRDPTIEVLVVEKGDHLKARLADFGVLDLPVRNRTVAVGTPVMDPEMESVIAELYAADVELHSAVSREIPT